MIPQSSQTTIRLSIPDRDPEAEIMGQEQPTTGSWGAKPRIAQNVWGNWSGYRGKTKVIRFTSSPYFSQEEAAEIWLRRSLELWTKGN